MGARVECHTGQAHTGLIAGGTGAIALDAGLRSEKRPEAIEPAIAGAPSGSIRTRIARDAGQAHCSSSAAGVARILATHTDYLMIPSSAARGTRSGQTGGTQAHIAISRCVKIAGPVVAGTDK